MKPSLRWLSFPSIPQEVKLPWQHLESFNNYIKIILILEYWIDTVHMRLALLCIVNMA